MKKRNWKILLPAQIIMISGDATDLFDMADLLQSDQSVLSANGSSDVDFFEDLMAVNGTTTQFNVSFGSMNLSDWIFSADDNNSWFCPQWNETEEEVGNSFTPSAFFQVIIYSLYGIVFVLALVGNMVVCAVVFTSIRKWTVTNFFIVNMAAGDILMAFFCIPFTFVPTFVLLYWPFGATMCRIVSFSQAVSVFVSAYTMVAISSDRYLAIVYPLRPRMTRKQAKVIKHIKFLLVYFIQSPSRHKFSMRVARERAKYIFPSETQTVATVAIVTYLRILELLRLGRSAH